jgi:hypothetical protein
MNDVGRRTAAIAATCCILLAATAVGSVMVRRPPQVERSVPEGPDRDRVNGGRHSGAMPSQEAPRASASSGSIAPAAAPAFGATATTIAVACRWSAIPWAG